jgi:hypothetical protein
VKRADSGSGVPVSITPEAKKFVNALRDYQGSFLAEAATTERHAPAYTEDGCSIHNLNVVI